MLVAVVNIGMMFAVPPVVVTSDEAAGEFAFAFSAAPLAGVDSLLTAAAAGAASTNADAGKPPTVSASPAFNA